MKHSIALGLALFAFWLLWSGHFSKLLVGLGFFSCVFVIFLARRMRIVDHESAPVHLGLRPFTFYAPWLAKRIVEANIDVACRILHRDMPIKPMMVKMRASQQGDLGRVILANSITLTPGTVSVDMQQDEIQVHALSLEEAVEDFSGEMNRRVCQLEEPN